MLLLTYLGLPAWPKGGSPITGRIRIETATGSAQFAPAGKTWLILSQEPTQYYYWDKGISNYACSQYHPGFSVVTENRGSNDAYFIAISGASVFILEIDRPGWILNDGSVLSVPMGVLSALYNINSSTATWRYWGFNVSSALTKVFAIYGVRGEYIFTPMCLAHGTIMSSLLDVCLGAIELPSDWPFVSNDYTLGPGAVQSIGTIPSDEMWIITFGASQFTCQIYINEQTYGGSYGTPGILAPPSSTIEIKNNSTTATSYASLRILKLPYSY